MSQEEADNDEALRKDTPGSHADGGDDAGDESDGGCCDWDIYQVNEWQDSCKV